MSTAKENWASSSSCSSRSALNKVSIWAKSLELGHRFLAGPLLLGVHVVVAVAQRLVGQVVKVLAEVE